LGGREKASTGEMGGVVIRRRRGEVISEEG